MVSKAIIDMLLKRKTRKEVRFKHAACVLGKHVTFDLLCAA
jgi:hypothetical protein